MSERKTHFEQVPLEVVKKIMGEQIKREEIAQPTPKQRSPRTTRPTAPPGESVKLR